MRRGPGPERRTPLTSTTGLSRTSGLDRGAPPARGGELARSAGLARVTPMPRAQPPAASTSSHPPSGKARPARDIPHRTRLEVYIRDDDRCVRCGRVVWAGTRSIQHRAPRGMGHGLANPHRLSNLLTVCGVLANQPDTCVEAMESRRLEAQAAGFLVPLGMDPATWPVHAFDGWHLYLDNGDRLATSAPGVEAPAGLGVLPDADEEDR